MHEQQLKIEQAVCPTGESSRRPILLASCGDSATGKTTISDGLVATCGRERITAACVDDYHRSPRCGT